MRLNTSLNKWFKKVKFIQNICINTIDININNNILEAIYKNCNYLNKVLLINSYHFYSNHYSEDIILNFVKFCGEKLITFVSEDYFLSENVISITLSFAPNLKSIQFGNQKLTPIHGKSLQKKEIQEIRFKFYDLNDLILFTDSYYKQIKKVWIEF